MRGLTLQEFTEVIEFVQKYHSFAEYKPPEERNKIEKLFPLLKGGFGFSIKYVDSCYDSRDKSIWSVVFRRGVLGVCLSTNHFNSINLPPKGWKYHSLFDWCMAYLTGEFVPTDEFFVKQ